VPFNKGSWQHTLSHWCSDWDFQCLPGVVVCVLQSDIESASPPTTSGSSEYDSLSSSDVAGQQGEGGDPTVRAQEIIGRAVSEYGVMCTGTVCAAPHTRHLAAVPR
jgi:hypothetical protein